MKTEKTHSPDSRSTTSAALAFSKDSETLAPGLPENSLLRLGVLPSTEATLIQCVSAAHGLYARHSTRKSHRTRGAQVSHKC